MSLHKTSGILSSTTKLWLVPFFTGLILLTLGCLAPGWLGSYSTIVGLALFLAEATLSLVLWQSWNRAERQLIGTGKELSSLQSIVNVSRDGIIGITTEGIIMSWNSGARSMYGYSAGEALGAHMSILFDDRRTRDATTLLAKVAEGDNVNQYETGHLRKGRTPIEVSLTICPIRERSNQVTGASIVARDITEQKRASESLAQQAAAMTASMDGMAIIDHLGECVYLNDAYAKTFGYLDPKNLIGATWETFYFEDEFQRIKKEIMPIVWRDGSWRGEASGRSLSGGTLPLEISISSVAGGGLVHVVRDITERRNAEEVLLSSSLKDELTGLFNRRGLLKQTAPYFDFARRQKEKLLLIFIDLDGMKRINDDFGHNEGDNALVNVASILSDSFRPKDIIARLGGDEFTVIVTDPTVDKDQTIARLNENLRAHNARETRGYKLSFSIGVATLEPERVASFEELLEKADHEMYQQKRIKKHRASQRSHVQQPQDSVATAKKDDSQVGSKLVPFAISSNPQQLYGGELGTFDQAAIGMAVVSADGSWLQVNEALCSLLGYSEQELRATSFQQLTHPDDLGTVHSCIQRVLGGYIQSHQQEMGYIHEQGHTVWVLCHVSLMKDSETGTERLFFQVQDISDRKMAEEKLMHDTLTGLANRARFHDFLKLRGAQAHKEQQFAVLFLDVDRFKLVNDSLGNSSGDQLLIQIAQRIKVCMRQGDILGRVGGDEFAILLDDVSGEEEACSVAARIQQAMAISFNLFGQEVYCTVSTGIALSGSYSEQVTDILRDAETAMHRAKSLGKARYELFGCDMHGDLVSRLKMETDLWHASERDQLVIHYQPIVSLKNSTLIGFEALVRWRHPEFGLISPKDFIPVAEETGQILAIGQVVLEAACTQARLWQTKFPDANLFVSVNLSVKQFNQPGLVEDIARFLADSKIAPHCLKLEITETAFTENIEAAVELLNRLRALGVQLSIDDFGTGYSSLSYLQRFPIDTLKIDRSFVNQMIENEENRQIVRTIVSLAQNLNLDVVAEGVETIEQLALLRELDCDNGQGFLFANPLEASELDLFITDFNMQSEDSPNQLVQLGQTIHHWPVDSLVAPQSLVVAAT
jgi:diguanylate cyclase (GGDEF)-like protein/PAS domain S-box-containing protein